MSAETVTLPKQAAEGLARAAGAKIGKTYSNHTWVTYPAGSPVCDGGRVIYGTTRNASVLDFAVRPVEVYLTDLIRHAEHALGIKITTTTTTTTENKEV